MEEAQSWEGMRRSSAELLLRRTGEDVEAWNRRIAALEFDDEDALRGWLDEQGVTGYPQWLLVQERFGYPDYMTATADELIDRQYADRPHLRPIFEAVLQAVLALGPATVQARKTYVSLLTPRRTFAVVRATTRQRVDLGLRLDGESAGGRLLPATGLANDSINLRLPLEAPEDLDEEAVSILERAYAASSGAGGTPDPRPATPSRRR